MKYGVGGDRSETELAMVFNHAIDLLIVDIFPSETCAVIGNELAQSRVSTRRGLKTALTTNGIVGLLGECERT